MTLRAALLGFLADQPLSGYDLRKAFEASTGHFWSADQGQIYRTLQALEKEGCVTVETIEQASRPDRKPYHITPRGVAELDTWLAAPARLAAERDPFLLQIFHAARLGPEAATRLLHERIAQAERFAATLEALAATLPPSGDLMLTLRRATLDNGRAHLACEIAWAQDLLTQLTPDDQSA